MSQLHIEKLRLTDEEILEATKWMGSSWESHLSVRDAQLAKALWGLREQLGLECHTGSDHWARMKALVGEWLKDALEAAGIPRPEQVA